METDGILQYTPATAEFVVIDLPVPTFGQLAFDDEFFYWRFEDGIYRWPRP